MSYLSIQRLNLRDYRCFASIDIDFHPQLTVLVASNGGGKTAILDAIAVAFGTYLGAFDEGIGKRFVASDIRLIHARDTQSSEVEYAKRGAHLEAEGRVPRPELVMTDSDNQIAFEDTPHSTWPIEVATWKRGLSGPVKAQTTIKDASVLAALGKALQRAVRTPKNDAMLPLLAYYGTGRLWQQKKLTMGKLTRTSRTIGYKDCLDPASSYKSLVEWFRYWYMNAQSDRIKAMEAEKPYQVTEFDAYIAAVSGAVDVCLAPAGWHSLSYSLSRGGLVVTHNDHGQLPVSLLSDGIRNMIGMVADIAFRAAKLNPQFGNSAAKETPGIVLIDEVDMHLHPEWQQVVLQSLIKAFPKLQFIVTTHSPQVLSTVRTENIRVLGIDSSGNGIASQPLAMTYGEPSGDVLHSVMNVDPQPPVEEKEDLQRLTELVDQGMYETGEARRLLQSLADGLGRNHPQLQRLQRSISRQEAMKR